jgi:hypothetical protein
MTVETSPQTLLVQEMGNETDRPTQDEQTVEYTHAEIVLSLLRRESTAVADQVDEADSDTAVHVKNQVVLLRGGDSLDSDGIIEQLVAREVLDDVLLDELDTQIRVVPRLDAMTDTRNELVLLSHGINEFSW